MTIVVGYPPNQRAQAALNLAAMLARSSGDDLVVCTVVPAPRVPGTKEHATRDEIAQRALEQARTKLASDVNAEFVVHNAWSAPSGLLEIVDQRQAGMLVVGSSKAGMFGYVTLSSVAARLLHGSPVPVALATRGFRCGADGRVTRVTVAYDGTQYAAEFARAVQDVVASVHGTVRLASFAVQPSPPDTALMRVEAGSVMSEWEADVRASAARMFSPGDDTGSPAEVPEVVVGYGSNWAEALDYIDWGHEGDLLAVGSSRSGPLARVFLGARATKIIRHSPVPVVVVPRAAMKDLGVE